MRLIEERELIRRISELPDLRTINTGTIGKIIKECRTIDAVEVVRCKDCRYRGLEGACPMCFEDYYDFTKNRGFCHRGKAFVDATD